MSIQIILADQRAPVDKTEKTVGDIFMAAGQIMFNYYMFALKKDIRKIRSRYTVRLAK